jgi:putative transcriptional regulator
MTHAFKSIQQGLTEAIAHAKTKDTETTGTKLYKPYAVNVSELRQRLRLTQEQFAARFGFSVASLRHWERGERSPIGASLVLLNVIDRNPTAVLHAFHKTIQTIFSKSKHYSCDCYWHL